MLVAAALLRTPIHEDLIGRRRLLRSIHPVSADEDRLGEPTIERLVRVQILRYDTIWVISFEANNHVIAFRRLLEAHDLTGGAHAPPRLGSRTFLDATQITRVRLQAETGRPF